MSVETAAPTGLVGTIRSAVSGTGASIGSVFRNRNLRRIQLAFAGSSIGDWAYSTAVIVWAYDVGGAKTVGIWGAIRLLLMAVVSPLAAGLADRLPRKQVMIASDLIRVVLVCAATACLYAGTPPAPVFVLATLVALIGCAFRPAEAALMPSLVDGPEQLTASNGVSSTIESLAFFVGPALGALMIALTDVETVFLLNAATFGLSALLVLGVRPLPGATAADPDEPGDEPGEGPGEGPGDDGKPGVLAEMLAGFSTIGRSGDLRLVAFIIAAQTLIAGASLVFTVILAVEVFATGAEGVGYVNSLFGVGAVLGGLVAIASARRNRQASDLAFGTLLWSLPLLLVAWQPVTAVVVVTMFLLGLGNPLVDVAFYTIVQRITPDEVLGRVFGAFEGVLIGSMALGAALMPWAVDQLGFKTALAVLALVVGVPVLLLLPATRRLDSRLRPPEGLDLLRGVPLFSPLGPATLESLARQLERTTVRPGDVVLREGEDSDRFYVIESGAVEITQDGAVLRQEHAGDFFGEIGLLRDVPRTATVTATEETVLVALTRSVFLGALAGSDESRVAAEDIVSRRLAT
ncbi:MFS transporter [Marmoricola sp. RAF53]|uniref:MFS transporter n=1 Tax=Marmoricola sp. RAF53 TaxID=3233059 RepID=UPI003F94EA9A